MAALTSEIDESSTGVERWRCSLGAPALDESWENDVGSQARLEESRLKEELLHRSEGGHRMSLDGPPKEQPEIRVVGIQIAPEQVANDRESEWSVEALCARGKLAAHVNARLFTSPLLKRYSEWGR